jgi:hypothetical protein
LLTFNFAEQSCEMSHTKLNKQQRWDPVSGLVRVSLRGSKALLILFSLVFIIKQGYDVTQTYLSQPLSSEYQVLPVSSMPGIRLTICRRIEIVDCTLYQSNNTCSRQSLPPYGISESYNTEFSSFRDTHNNNESSAALSFQHILDQIQYWNESVDGWEDIFDSLHSTVEEEIALFNTQMYPFTGNYTLLCHTLKHDVKNLGPMLKFLKKGKNNILTKLINSIYRVRGILSPGF